MRHAAASRFTYADYYTLRFSAMRAAARACLVCAAAYAVYDTMRYQLARCHTTAKTPPRWLRRHFHCHACLRIYFTRDLIRCHAAIYAMIALPPRMPHMLLRCIRRDADAAAPIFFAYAILMIRFWRRCTALIVKACFDYYVLA